MKLLVKLSRADYCSLFKFCSVLDITNFLLAFIVALKAGNLSNYGTCLRLNVLDFGCILCRILSRFSGAERAYSDLAVECLADFAKTILDDKCSCLFDDDVSESNSLQCYMSIAVLLLYIFDNFLVLILDTVILSNGVRIE